MISSSNKLNKIVRSKSSLSRSKADVPSARTVLTLSRNFPFRLNSGCLSLRMSTMFGCRRKATTFSL